MKQLCSLALAVGLILCLFAGCASNKEAQKQKDAQDMIQSAQKEGSMQPGATVTTGRDQSGNATFTYTNPDGTGGGGVAID